MVVLQGVRGACFCLQVLCLYMCMIFQYDCSIWLLTKASLPKSVLISSSTSINLWPWGTTSRYFFRHASIGYIYIRIYISISMSISISISISISFYIYIYVILYHSISISISISIYIYIHSFVPMDGCHLWLFSPTPEALPRHSLGCEDCPRGGQGQDGVEKLWLVLGVLYPDGSLMSWGVPHLKCLMLFLTSRPFRVFLFLHISKKVHVLFWIWSKKKLARKPW